MNGFQVIIEDYQLDPTALPNCVAIHNGDHQLNINALPNCVINLGKLQIAHSVEKKTLASDHALSDRVITRGKQTVARSGEINNFVNNHDQQKKIVNHNLSIDVCQTSATDNNIYLVEQVKNHRHPNGKLEFLIKCWVTRTVITPRSQETICPPPLCKNIFNNFHRRNQRQLMQSS